MGTPKGTIPWNAGTSRGWTDKRGYRWVYVTENGRRGARREHRAVVERHLGRKLEPWELVHHRDGDKTNNSLSNLEVSDWGSHTVEHHTGGRKSEDARRSMEAFALLREKLKREREIKSDLLEALRGMVEVYAVNAGPSSLAHETEIELARLARAAIAKALGESEQAEQIAEAA